MSHLFPCSTVTPILFMIASTIHLLARVEKMVTLVAENLPLAHHLVRISLRTVDELVHRPIPKALLLTGRLLPI
jgi:hypothetical protein